MSRKGLKLSPAILDEEQHLSESEYLRRIVDVSPNIIYARDHEGRFQFANHAFADLLQLAPEQICGRTISELGLDSDEHEMRWRRERSLFKSGGRDFIPEERFVDRLTGEVRWFRTVRIPLPAHGGIVPQVLTISTDLTERKRAEDVVRKILEGTASATAENFFRSLVKELATVLSVRYCFIGQVDTDRKQMIRTIAVYRDGTHIANEDYNLSGTPTQQVLQNGLQQITDNVQTLFPHDAYLRAEGINSYMGAPLLSNTGEPIGILSVMDSKPLPDWAPGRWIMRIFAARAAAEVERIESERKQTILQRQLQQAQKMEAIGQLAAGIAHDLNNALGAVVGHLELLNIAARLDPEWRSSVQTALKGCERASSLIDQLLGFSRQGRYNVSVTGICRLTQETLAFIGRVIEKNIKVTVDHLAEDLTIEVDQAQIQQALTNIILNAAQAMPDGGAISISFERTQVMNARQYNVHANDSDFTVIRIQDQGSGIARENLEKIFDPFFTTKEQGKGSGLGLSMVYGIMQSHGGWIGVDSELQKGSTFSLYFPSVDVVETHKPRQRLHTATPTARGSILVIDDEEMLVDLSVKFLERAGFTVHGFTSAIKALAWFKDHANQIDLAVIDMKMPEINGPLCFAKLREIRSELPVIILSGYTQDSHVQELIRQGAVTFFHKPLKYQELINWIKDFLKVHVGASQ